ncbi:MAG: hypothetical protein AAB451_04040 [Patescibacteria group bacterium]
MKMKYFISFVISIIAVAGFINLVKANDIQYPVNELGGCKSQADCKSYCDKPKNTKACLNFAEKNNLMSEEDIQLAKNFIAAGSKGPGGCAGKDSCEQYCNDISHIDECISFAEKNDLMPPKELEEAKKVQAAITRGVKPPPCGNKKACDVYCGETDHMEECINFGKEAGFIQGKELEDVEKMLQAVKRGVKPPPCNGKEACDEYCNNSDNMEVCINFAMEAGFMNDQEKADSQKMLAAVKKGVKPPNCRGKEDCDVYCGQDDHFEECTNFAIAAGFVSEEDAEMIRKTGGKGPGGCKGKDECEAFCNNPDNQETCFNFGRDNGLIPEEDLKKMEEGKQQMMDALNQAPPEVIDCIGSRVGLDLVEKLRNGTGMPSREIGDTMQACFQEMNNGPGMGPSSDTIPEPWQEGQPKGDEIMPPKQTGPGGCQSEEECQSYCAANPQECGAPAEGQFQQAPPEGQMPPTEQFNPPPTTEQSPPQSFLDKAKDWLAGAGFLIKK